MWRSGDPRCQGPGEPRSQQIPPALDRGKLRLRDRKRLVPAELGAATPALARHPWGGLHLPLCLSFLPLALPKHEQKVRDEQGGRGRVSVSHPGHLPRPWRHRARAPWEGVEKASFMVHSETPSSTSQPHDHREVSKLLQDSVSLSVR